MKKLSYSRQFIDRNDIKKVLRVLQSDFLTCGPKILQFEKKFSQFVGAKYAVAVSSGTAGLHLACLAVGLKQDDELITSALTFAASANCALYCQAKPVFVDINDNGLINEDKIQEKINKKTKVIAPVHYSGLPCQLDKIKKLAQKHKLYVIEDASHALGAKYKKSLIGDCKYSDMAVFSFHPVKHITTGEGGMITTNTKILYKKLLLLRTHGITKDPKEFSINNQQSTINNNKSWYQEMQDLGFNYRLTDIQAVLGISQLGKLKLFIKKRRKIAAIYNKAFNNFKQIKIIKEDKNQFNSYHLYTIRVKDEKIRFRLFNYLNKNNIYCQVHYIPVYWHPFYQRLACPPSGGAYKKGLCPKAEKFYKQVLSIPIFPQMSSKDTNFVIKNIFKFFSKVK